MATLVIEDGTVVTGANSYVTVAEVTTFCSDRGLTSWAELGSPDKITAIIRGMDYVETFNFKGEKYSYDDPLEWPRVGVYDDINLEPEFEEYYQEIPPGLKNAVCRAAYEESVSPGVLQTSLTSGIRREKIDVLEIEYFGTQPSRVVYQTIEGYLKGLLKSGNVLTVLRT
jgi:hypothetical protein